MSIDIQPAPGAGAVPGWFRAMCLVLIVLLVHNPYLMAPAMAGGVNLSHPPSYRATIAASELQHFTPPGSQSVFPALAGPASKDLEPLPADGRHTQIHRSQVASPPQQFWCAGLWFRPPPLF
jgi:hypothetical protein